MVNGYVDIGLIDTMKDLIVNFVGAAVFCFIGFQCSKGKERYQSFLRNFIFKKFNWEENSNESTDSETQRKNADNGIAK